MKKELAQTRSLFSDDTFVRFSINRKTGHEAYPQPGLRTAQELQWRKDYIANWVSQLAVDDLTALEKLSEVGAVETLADLILMADDGDSYAKLQYANAIWELAKNGGVTEEIRAEGRKAAILLWQSLVKGPVIITKEHRAKVTPLWGLLSSATAEALVQNEAKSKLDMVEEQRKTRTKPYPALKTTKRHISAAIVNFEEGGAGCIEEKVISANEAQTYKFMPFRSLSHHNLWLELKKKGVAQVEIEMEDKIIHALVTTMDSKHITLSVLPEEEHYSDEIAAARMV